MFSVDKPSLKCENCHVSCQTCSAPGDSKCMSCVMSMENFQDTKYYYQNQCYDKCPSSHTYDPGSNNCYKCFAGIKVCQPGNPLLAIACETGLYLHKSWAGTNLISSCLSSCPLGYYGNRLTNTCEHCDDKCSKCKGSPKICQSCAQQDYGDARFFHTASLQTCTDECMVGFRPAVNKSRSEAMCIPIPCGVKYCAAQGCTEKDNFCDICQATYYEESLDEFLPVIPDSTNGVCVICSKNPQIFSINDLGECYNTCGNGYLYDVGNHDPSNCDDGNRFDGDGCSSDCLIESDYVCNRGTPGTPESEKPQKNNKDVCVEQLQISFEINTENPTGNPRIDLKFNVDVCFSQKSFTAIYEPFCVKKDPKTGYRTTFIDFQIKELETCKWYAIEYNLKDNYSGDMSFIRKDQDDVSATKVKYDILDSRSNAVDFTKVKTSIYFDDSEMKAKQKLQETKKTIEDYQKILAGPMLLAIMAIGPLADFTANVLQKLVYLMLLDIQYPMKVDMFLILAGNLGNTDPTGSGSVDSGTNARYASSMDEMLDLTIADQQAPAKFKLRNINPLFIKSALPPITSLLLVYFATLLILILDRRYKKFDNKENEYIVESELAASKRHMIYMLVKGIKQKIVWKNFLRAFTTSFQPIMIGIMLNIKLSSLSKPLVTVSTLLSY
jgi:cysteine-rich repeat protein